MTKAKARPKKRPEDRPASLLLLDVRNELGLAGPEVATMLGVTTRTVERWVSGDADPPPLVRHILTCSECRKHFLQSGTPRL